MKSLNHTELNRLNNDAWVLIHEAFKVKNWALMESAIGKLYVLQKHYLYKLNRLDIESSLWKDIATTNQATIDSFERDYLLLVSKNEQQKNEIKERFNKNF